MSLSKVVLELAISQVRAILDIEQRVATEISKYQAAVTQQAKELCPSPQQLQKLINLRDKIDLVLISVARKSNSQLQTNESLSSIIETTQAVIFALKLLAVPNATTTVGVTNTSSDILKKVSDKVDIAEAVVNTSTVLLTTITSMTVALQGALRQLNVIINFCSDSEEEDVISIEDSQIQDQASAPTLPQNYRDFKLDIVNIKNFEDNLVRRQAVALYPNGTVAFRSSKSFATSDEVLLEQVKIQIDRSITPQGDTVDDIITSTIETTLQRSADISNIRKFNKQAIKLIELKVESIDKELNEEVRPRIERFRKQLQRIKNRPKSQQNQTNLGRAENRLQDLLNEERKLTAEKQKLQAEITRLANF